MRKVNFFVMLVLSLCLFACSGEKEKSADSIKLDTNLDELGDLTKYVKFPGSLTLKVVEESGDKVKFETSIKLDVKTDVCSDVSFSFNLDVENGNHSVISNLGSFRPKQDLDTYVMDFKDYLKSGTIEDVHKYRVSKDKWEKILTDGANVKISNAWSSAQFKRK